MKSPLDTLAEEMARSIEKVERPNIPFEWSKLDPSMQDHYRSKALRSPQLQQLDFVEAEEMVIKDFKVWYVCREATPYPDWVTAAFEDERICWGFQNTLEVRRGVGVRTGSCLPGQHVLVRTGRRKSTSYITEFYFQVMAEKHFLESYALKDEAEQPGGYILEIKDWSGTSWEVVNSPYRSYRGVKALQDMIKRSGVTTRIVPLLRGVPEPEVLP